MSTAVMPAVERTAETQLVALRPTVESTMRQACEGLATACSLERFEIAVKSRLQQGIKDDNDLRLTDDLLASVCRGGDAVEALTRPAIKAADELHDALLGVSKEYIYYTPKTKTWSGRWGALRMNLTSLILKYKRDREELAKRQQEELDRAAAADRQRKEAEARAARRAGNVTAAKAAMEEAQTIVAPIIAEATPVLDSAKDRKPWEVEITDPEAVVKAVAAGVIPLSVIKEFDLTFLKKEAAKRGGLNWPGISAKQVSALSVRR